MAEHACTTESLSITTTCKDHQQQCIPVYCKDCKTPVCSVCVIKEQHSKHNLTGIVDAANETQINLQELLHDRNRVLEHAQSLDSHVDDIIKVCDLYKEGVIQTISERADTIVQETLKIKSELIEKVVGLSECRGCELQDASYNVQTVIRVLNSLENCNDLCMFNDVEKAHFKLKLQNVLKMKVEDLPYQSGFPFSFKTSDFNLQMFQSNVFGEIIDENETASNFHERNTAKTTKGSESEQDTHTKDSSDSEQYFDYETDDTTQEARVYRFQNRCIKNIIPVDACYAHVLVDRDLYKMNFSTGEITSTLLMKNVQQISTTPNDTVLVIQTDSKTISHILEDRRIVAFCKSEKWQPTAVCSSNKAFAIIMMYENYLCEKKCHSLNVAEYDHDGVVVRKICQDYFNDYYSFQYKFLCHSRSDEIMYVYWPRFKFLSNSGVYICDANLKVKKAYTGSIGPDPENCFKPTGICIDDNNQILVVVPWDNAIHLLIQSGKYIRLLLSEKDNMQRPYCVLLDKRGNLWVGTENGDIIIRNYKKLSSSVGCK